MYNYFGTFNCHKSNDFTLNFILSIIYPCIMCVCTCIDMHSHICIHMQWTYGVLGASSLRWWRERSYCPDEIVSWPVVNNYYHRAQYSCCCCCCFLFVFLLLFFCFVFLVFTYLFIYLLVCIIGYSIVNSLFFLVVWILNYFYLLVCICRHTVIAARNDICSLVLAPLLTFVALMWLISFN